MADGELAGPSKDQLILAKRQVVGVRVGGTIVVTGYDSELLLSPSKETRGLIYNNVLG